jgi:prepilin-type N-terminal cleavage/methylation domain-containing protein
MKRGFTLLELMLVIVLMGIVYGSVINVFERYKDKAIDVTLMSLEKYMQSFSHNNHVSLVCIKRCEECLLFVNEAFVQNVTPFTERDVQLYRFDRDSGVKRLELLPHFRLDGQEEEACFRYDIHPDGSRTEMIVKNNKDVFVFPSFFGTVQKYSSLNEAIEKQSQAVQKVADQ